MHQSSCCRLENSHSLFSESETEKIEALYPLKSEVPSKGSDNIKKRNNRKATNAFSLIFLVSFSYYVEYQPAFHPNASKT